MSRSTPNETTDLVGFPETRFVHFQIDSICDVCVVLVRDCSNAKVEVQRDIKLASRGLAVDRSRHQIGTTLAFCNISSVRMDGDWSCDCPCCREPGRTCSRMLECSEENVFGAEVNCYTKVWSLSLSTEMLLNTHCSPQSGEIADGNVRWFSSSPSGLVTKVGTGTPREG